MRSQLHKIATLAVVVIATMTLVNCSRERTDFDTNWESDKEEIIDPESTGYVNLAGLNLAVDIEDESFNDQTVSDIKSRAAASRADGDVEPADPADAYFVMIKNEKTGEMVFDDTYAAAKQSALLTLKAGYYILRVASVRETPATAWGDKVYSSEEKRLVVGDSDITEIGNITCRLATIKTQVAISADMREVFDTENTETPFTVTLTYGTSELVYTNDRLYDATASADVNEANTGYFGPQEGVDKINITMRGLYNSAQANEAPKYQEIEWSQNITGVAASQSRMITIRVDNSQSSKVQISFEVQKWSYDEPLGVNIFDASYGLALNEDTIVDPDDEETFESDKNSPVLALENGNITDIFKLNSNTIDVESETYSPLYKATVTPAEEYTTIKSITLIASSTNTKFTDKVVADGYLDLYIPIFFEGESIAAMNDYLTAKVDDATGKVSVTVKYNGMAELYKYEGTHTFKVMATDSQDRTSFTDLVFESAGAAGSGPAPTLVWDGGTFGEVTDITNASDLKVILDVTSETGIESMVINIVSDVLTDSELKSIGLAAKMDVANPETPETEAGLGALGIPVAGLVKGQKVLSVDISVFIPTLAGLKYDGDSATTNFEITVADKNGEVSNTIMLISYYN